MLIILFNRIYYCLFYLSSNCVVKGEGQRLRGTDRALQLKVVFPSIFWRNDFVWCITFDIVNQACSQSSLVEFWSSRFLKNKIRKVKKLSTVSPIICMYLLQVYSKTTGRTHYVQIPTKEGYQLSLDFRSTLQKENKSSIFHMHMHHVYL